MSTLWLFREMRSGSTAFTDLIALKLKRPYKFIELKSGSTIKHPLPDPETNIYHTHEFSLLREMPHYDNPTLIRCTRRNRVDQYLSALMMRWLGKTVYQRTEYDNRIFNVRAETKENDEKIFTTAEPAMIARRELYHVHQMYTESNRLWNEYAHLYNNYTVYYEDLCEGIDIPLLGLTDFKLTNDLQIKKIPDYKRRVFLNYDMLVGWIEEMIEDFG